MKYKISEKEIALRKCYTELTEEDVALLRELQPIVTAHLDELVDAFYSLLLEFEGTKKILKNEATVKRLKDAQRRYLTSLFSGDYGPEYIESRMRIGEVHHKVGVDIKWYLGAVHCYEWLLVGLIRKYAELDEDKLLRAEKAICTILYFETQWVLDAFELACTGEVRNTIDELRVRTQQQAAVSEFGLYALTGAELSELMDAAVTTVAKVLDVEYCKVLELLPDGKAFLLKAGVGWKEGHVGRATVGTEKDSQAGYTLLSSKPVILEDLRKETRFSSPPLLLEHDVVSGMSVIIHGKDRPFGVLGTHTSRQRTFTKHDINFFQAVANVLAEAIQRRLAEEERKQNIERLQKALGGTIEALATTVETRGPYTAGHQQRVADLARAIAKEMGLPEEQVEGISMAGIIHDVGKIAVPAEILSKPGKITKTEFEMIKTHSQVGYDILKNVEFPRPIAKIVLQHHERMDGSGYPGGLDGGEIFIEARILGVADVVEAMSSHRPYRPALGIDAALDEIRKKEGVLYDADVVNACVRLFREKLFEFKLS